jgi:glycosyltransferase involved in cell wall biosynthesis
MGSKKKEKSKEVKNPTVSIVTITQLKRFPCLEIVKDMIKAQTYQNIIEWVIVEGSQSESEWVENAVNIQKLREDVDFKISIIYIEKIPGEKLGALRNKGNKACSGDITVVMDDDDYYPAERVEHAVNKLQSSSFLIAGCSDMFIYDYTIEKLCRFIKFGEYHSVNSCFAWKKKYLETHSHDETKDTGEEPSFTNEFKEPLIQLDADKTIIQSSHGSNTYNKREILTAGITKVNTTVREIDEPITNYIKEPFFSRLKSIFYKEEKSKYDIVYFTGGFSINWDPTSKKLGGSEQAVVNLSLNWVKLGKKVAVYGFVKECHYEGVDYFDWKKFPFNEQFDTLILWRLYGLLCAGPFNIKANRIWLDLHDGIVIKSFLEFWFRYGSKVNKVFFKSQYHKDLFEKAIPKKLLGNQYIIIPNGVRIDEFSVNKDNVPRNPYRFCYCSCYTRGLMQILMYMWPIIKDAEPRAELHLYYGMDLVVDKEFKKIMTELIARPGVMDHGRQPMDLIIREKYMSNFHLYLSNSDSEIDCITVRESCVTGAIPILSSHGVFKDRDGIHFEIVEDKPMTYANVALNIINIMKDPNLDTFRNNLKGSSHLIRWMDVAKLWLKEMN